MNRFISLFLFFIPFIISAQVNLTFSVDMNNASGFNPSVHKVYLSGANQGASAGIGAFPIWPMPGSVAGFIMTDPDTDGLYSLTIPGVSAGVYAYKYFLVENDVATWSLGEWGGDPNRLVTVETTNVQVRNIWAQIADNTDINLVINEVMASNAVTISDEDGDYEDWIEIYNAGAGAVNLSGFGLSDNVNIPFKWVFPNQTIFPGQYLLVWASGKNRSVAGNPLHTSFSISTAGEPVILTGPDEVIIDMIPEVVYRTDISYGRFPNATDDLLYMTTPTPGWANSGPGYSLLLQPLVFSHFDGFYASPFNLSITSTDPGTTIRYTLDGSEPNVGSTLYQGPVNITSRAGQANTISMIPTNNNSEPGPPYYEGWQAPSGEVFKINVVRAKAFHANAPESETHTYSYLVDGQAENRYSLPVFSLNTSNENLFDNDIGIYVHGNNPDIPNFFQNGWERPANLTYFERNGVFAFKEDIGIRLNGNTTRSRPRKSFRIIAKSEYGSSWINYRLFPDKETDMYKRFILRNSGNDWDFTVFRDGMFQYLAKNLNVETQYYQPAILFINGEYWGIHNIRDKYDNRYIYAKYGFEEEEMTILADNAVYKWGAEAGKTHYNNMISFVANNSLQNTGNYNQLKEKIDIESYIDYQLTHIFVKNTDWPGNNALYWRYFRDDYAPDQGVRDGRWRWMILDTDFGFDLPFFYVPGLDDGPLHNTLNFATNPSGPGWPNPSWSTLMLRKLLENNEFRIQFINRYCDLLNTTFSSAHVISVTDSISKLLAPEMPEHINRWRRPTSVSEWNDNVNVLRNFAAQRPASQMLHMREKFSLQMPASLTVNVSASKQGYVRVNTIDLKATTMGVSKNPYPWTGSYFRGVPIVLEAIPNKGYVFSHWSGASSSTDKIISITMTADTQITANFVASAEEQLIHYWFFGTDVPNDTPLENLDATYSLLSDARIDFHSALNGYPFDNAHPNWRKASMERRNSPTEINYKHQGNNDIPYAEANMRALQIKQPFAGDGGENTLYFSTPTLGFRDIKFQFAAKDEGAATSLVIDYSVAETKNWISDGLSVSSLPLSPDFTLFELDFSNLAGASNNTHFSIRIRFAGTNMTADEGNRVTFNNFSITGIDVTSGVETKIPSTRKIIVYPNPADDYITIMGENELQSARIYDVSGRLVLSAGESTVNVAGLKQGIYIIQVTDKEGIVRAGKFMKR